MNVCYKGLELLKVIGTSFLVAIAVIPVFLFMLLKTIGMQIIGARRARISMKEAMEQARLDEIEHKIDNGTIWDE